MTDWVHAPLLELRVFCTDVDATAAFYAALGRDIYPWPPDRTVSVDLVGTALVLAPATPENPVTHCAFTFQVPDITVPQAGLTRLGVPWQPVDPARFGTTDPDHRPVLVVEHLPDPD